MRRLFVDDDGWPRAWLEWLFYGAGLSGLIIGVIVLWCDLNN